MQSYEELIKQTALDDERFMVMTAENRAIIRSLPPILGDRFLDTGITEQCMIGTAAGLALRGRIPIVHALATFLTLRAFEFIRTDVGIAHLPVKLSSFVPGFMSDGNGPTHQAIEDVALMRGIPGMQVFCPSDNEDMLGMLPNIWASPDPSYVRINTRPAVISGRQPFEVGKAEVLAEGDDMTILVYGMLLEQCLEAKEILAGKGISVGLVNLRSLQPIDEATLAKVFAKQHTVFAVEDHFQTGGLYSILAEYLLGRGQTARVISKSLGTRWYKPGLLSEVLSFEGFTGPQLADFMEKNLEK